MDVMTAPIPDSHVWVVILACFGCYVAGRLIVGGLR